MPTRTGILAWIMAVLLGAFAFAAEPVQPPVQKPPTRDELLMRKGAVMQAKEAVVEKANADITNFQQMITGIDAEIAKLDGTAKTNPDKTTAKVAEKPATK